MDMYSGSGIMGLEALSRGFSRIVMIEKNKKIYNVIKSNIKNMKKMSPVETYRNNSTRDE